MNDLARYNYGYKYWLVCVDVYSRYVFVKLLKNKRDNSVGKKFEEIIKSNGGNFPERIQSDEGTEFQNIRKDLSQQYGFRVFHTYNREIKASHAERVIQTLKTMVRRVITMTKDYNYAKYLPLVVQRYNGSPHRGIFGLTPAQVYFRTKKIPMKRKFESVLRDYSITKKILKIGTKVRIVRAKNSVFEKSSLQRWTRETFVIYRVFLTDPVTYAVRDLEGEVIQGRFYRNELQVL